MLAAVAGLAKEQIRLMESWEILTAVAAVVFVVVVEFL